MTKPDPSVSYSPTPLDKIDLKGTKIAVVGGTNGLGRAIAQLAASKGASVTVVGRTFQGDEGISFIKADLSLMTEAEKVGNEVAADSKIVIFTNGIMASSARQESAEGIELDMAVSTLSRHVILKSLVPRLDKSTRIFIMGFPGAGQAGTNLDDLNCEKSYGFNAAHMNTVAGNEALVHYLAAKGVKVYGLNPGLIKTGIRSNAYGNGWIGGSLSYVVEGLLGWFTPTPEQYATKVLPLLVAPEIDDKSGAMFGQDGKAVLPTPAFKEAGWTDKWIEALDGLYARAQKK